VSIDEAKRRLPLPALMHRLGLGDHAKKSARCPLHDDQHNSFSVWQEDGIWFWKCHAGCGGGDGEFTLYQNTSGGGNTGKSRNDYIEGIVSSILLQEPFGFVFWKIEQSKARLQDEMENER